MSKDHPNSINVEVAAKAEAKLEIKAEVPTASVGRLVDAFTDIIRPFSEGRGLRADLLRLQREEVAIEIARRARQRIGLEQEIISPVPPKILVPLMERGSCEEISDNEMINRWANLLASAARWANLLASAATGQTVHPRFVSILGELSGRQALALEQIAFGFAQETQYPYVSFVDASSNFGQYWISNEISSELRSILTSRRKIDAAFDWINNRLSAPGCYWGTTTLSVTPSNNFYSASADLSRRINPSDLNVLESLGLIQKSMIDFKTDLPSKKPGQIEVSIFYHHLTDLGVEFCEVCCRENVAILKKLNEDAAAQYKAEHPSP